jgi:hypothetical protein
VFWYHGAQKTFNLEEDRKIFESRRRESDCVNKCEKESAICVDERAGWHDVAAPSQCLFPITYIAKQGRCA